MTGLSEVLSTTKRQINLAESQSQKIEKSIVLVGLARDCARALPSTLAFCVELETIFNSIHFVFVENASNDATRQMLERWSRQRPNATVLTPPDIADEDSRTKRIAACRNAAIEFIASSPAKTDYLLMVDMDLGLTGNDASAIRDATIFMSKAEGCAAVFPNSKPLYYDLFALRHPFWCPNDVWQDVDRAWREWRTDDDHLTPPEDIYVRSRQLLIPTDLSPIKVDSAFGGIGLYRWELAKDGKYSGVDDGGRLVCEHVSFHKSINGQKYILPSWCIKAPSEHLPSAFRTEFPHERELRRRRSRLAFRDKLIKRVPSLGVIWRWAIR